MELTKLPMNLGITVVDALKKYNIEPRRIENGPFKGMLSLEFTQEELDMVKEISIINPVRQALNGIEKLRYLEILSISTAGNAAYDKSPASITDKDILKISKLNSLKSLIIDNQSSISWLYLDNLQKLENLKIIRNNSLEEISGLDKLKNIKEFVEYGNKELYKIENIDKMIDNNKLDVIELDVLHYDEIIKKVDVLNKMINCDFSETVSGNKTISYSYYQMLLFHQKCLSIANQAKRISQDNKNQIIFVENYLAKNIIYDYDGKYSDKRVHVEDGKQKGKSNGINSAYNGIIFGSAVCEGYTRSMQYILKLIGIKTKNVYCIGGANRISINESYHDQVILPDDNYHSIIRIDDHDSIYYCDPCWDSCRFHRGDTTLPYCLLTKKEMSKTHTMSFEENNVIYDISYPRDRVLKTVQYINSFDNTINSEYQTVNKNRRL